MVNLSREQAIKGVKGFINIEGALVCNKYEFLQKEANIHYGQIKMCNSGFHFCRTLEQAATYYPPDKNRNTVYYEVLGYGQLDEQHDKLVCSILEIGDEVLYSTLEEKRFNEILKLAVELSNQGFIISGSLNFVLHGLLNRKVGDIDLVAPYFMLPKLATNMQNVLQHYGSMDYTFFMPLLAKDIKVEVKVVPQESYRICKTKFGDIRVQQPHKTLMYKSLCIQGDAKHLDDILEIAKNYKTQHKSSIGPIHEYRLEFNYPHAPKFLTTDDNEANPAF